MYVCMYACMYICMYVLRLSKKSNKKFLVIAASTAVMFFVSFSNLISYSMYINLSEFVRLDYSPSVIWSLRKGTNLLYKNNIRHTTSEYKFYLSPFFHYYLTNLGDLFWKIAKYKHNDTLINTKFKLTRYWLLNPGIVCVIKIPGARRFLLLNLAINGVTSE